MKMARMLVVVFALLPLIAVQADAPAADANAKCAKPAEWKGLLERASDQRAPDAAAADATCDTDSAEGETHDATQTEPVEMTLGSPPMMSDDTGTPGPNHWEINFLMTADLAAGEREIDLPVLDANYGIGDRIELTFEVPYSFSSQHQPAASGSAVRLDKHGVGDTTLGVKYRFFDDKDSGLSLAIYPEVLVKTPGTSAETSSDKTTVLLPLLLTKEFERASVTANVGVEASNGTRRYFSSFGVGTRLTENVALLAEVVGTNLNAADEKHVLVNMGLTRKISETQSIQGALGHDIYAGGDQRQHTYVTLAYQLLFGH